MAFAGVNYLAILVAAVLSMPIGAAWYGGLGKQWMKAARLEEKDIKQEPKLYLITALCQLVIAVFLAGVIGHLSITGIGAGMITAFFCWLGFVVPTMIVNHRFQTVGWDLTLIDSGHWLLVFVLQGAVIGWFGV